ncbi:hypothetical protein [Bradyrhizobium sp. WSM2254]|uniref:plasmid mobilization protein n=1 Tax=Bradyrhizobium sp. WSM2254 TaxID=1188263 RepID=UPI0012EB862C|nr:hypothetical protein [Bradyrhizobium sp. WSM2254]
MTSSDGQRRRFRITIRVSFAERAALDEAAREAGFTLSAHVRRVLVDAKPVRSSRRPSIEASLVVSLLDRLGCIASNLGRITCTLQVGSPASLPGIERDLARSLNELRSLRPLLLQALGKRPKP